MMILNRLKGTRTELMRRVLKRVARRPVRGAGLSEARYAEWITENEPDARALDEERRDAAALPYQPLISLITPVYHPDPEALRAAIQSVSAQTYANWQLCLVDGGSNLVVQQVLQEFANSDPRICLITLEQNRGISGNSNAAIEMARGEFLALLDHDDTLAPFALYQVAKLLNQDRRWDLIYSDHDVMAADGRRRAPLFKPDWSPEILLSANYITHLTVIRSARIKEVGGFDPDTDGAQDWDLFLRVVERTDRVAHIPRILYHWRDAAGSTATDIYAKAYAPTAQLRAIQGHLARVGLTDGKAFFDRSGFIRVGWSLQRSRKISIIIPTYGASALLERCIQSILTRSVYPDYQILIVNNGNRRPEEFGYFATLAQDERIRVLHYDGPFNYSAVNNYGARFATGDLLLFLNNDTEILAPDWLNELAMWAERDPIGVVGAKLLRPNGTIQHAGVVIGLTGFAGHVFEHSTEGRLGIFGCTEWYRDYLAVTGACLMVRREVFEQVGKFSEEFILCGSDVEFCLRVKEAGYRVVYNPFCRLTHLEAATRKGTVPARDYAISLECYRPALEEGDPFYNPNLSYWSAEPTLRTKGEPLPLEFARDYVRSHPEEAGAHVNG